MDQLLQGKYKFIEKVPKRQKKYQTWIVQKIQNTGDQNQKGKKYIAKIQDLVQERKNHKGKSIKQKIPRSSLALEEEIQIILDIQRNIDKIGFPKAYDVYSLNQKRVLMTDLRSVRLPKLIPLLLKNFNVPSQYTKFCLRIIYDLLDRVQSIHTANYVHEYLRPQFINFKKADNNKDVLFISDYSETQKFNEYNIKKQNYHRPYQYCITPRGKSGFASIWTHAKMSRSRRDDLQSFCYISIFLLRGGEVPWDDVQFGVDQKSNRQTFQMKLKIINSDIFESQKQQQQTAFQTFISFVQAISGKSEKSPRTHKKIEKIPKQIRQILMETRNLGFQQQPNYHHLRKLLKKVMNRFQVNQTDDYLFPFSDQQLYPKGF